MPDRYSKETRSYVMSRIQSKNTKPEIKLRKALWAEGIRGYKLYSHLPGRPDIAFHKKRLAIFVDGDFWHGKDFKKIWERIKDKPYWAKKIPANMERDKKNTKMLKEQGWKVLRFWESEIKENREGCVRIVKKEIG